MRVGIYQLFLILVVVLFSSGSCNKKQPAPIGFEKGSVPSADQVDKYFLQPERPLIPENCRTTDLGELVANGAPKVVPQVDSKTGRVLEWKSEYNGFALGSLENKHPKLFDSFEFKRLHQPDLDMLGCPGLNDTRVMPQERRYFWGMFMASLAFSESSFDRRMSKPKKDQHGLFGLKFNGIAQHGPDCVFDTDTDLQTPPDNIKCAATIMANQLEGGGNKNLAGRLFPAPDCCGNGGQGNYWKGLSPPTKVVSFFKSHLKKLPFCSMENLIKREELQNSSGCDISNLSRTSGKDLKLDEADGAIAPKAKRDNVDKKKAPKTKCVDGECGIPDVSDSAEECVGGECGIPPSFDQGECVGGECGIPPSFEGGGLSK